MAQSDSIYIIDKNGQSRESIESVLRKVENRDPSVLFLFNVGDSRIRIDENSIKDDMIECKDVHDPSGEKYIVPIFKHETVIVSGWNNNGVYYNLDILTFPNAKNIIMLSHPCEYIVPWRSEDWSWILPYEHFYKVYFEHHPGLQIMTFEEYERLSKALLSVKRYYVAKNKGILQLKSTW